MDGFKQIHNPPKILFKPSFPAGCYHNGTIYAERSLIPTVEPCLTCRCANKSLVCALKICPEQAFPPPRGCVLVQPKRACCPYLSCKTFRRNPVENELLLRMKSFAISHGKYDVDKEQLTDGENGVSDNNLQRSDDIDLHEENNGAYSAQLDSNTYIFSISSSTSLDTDSVSDYQHG